MTDHESLNVEQVDQAYDQAMSAIREMPDPPLIQLGCNHGIRMMRQRIGGQFLRNQAHHVTSDQLKAVEGELRGEIARHEAPSPELTSATVRDHADYWQGFEQGVVRYQSHLLAGTPSPAVAARRPRP